jgi:hypothetical protein
LLSAHFVEGKAVELMEGDPAGEGFRALTKEIRRSASEDEKASLGLWTIHEYTKHRKQIGSTLNLVNDDESVERSECKLRLRETGEVVLIFKIEPYGGLRATFHQLAREGRLAHLPRSKKGDDGVSFQQVLDRPEMAFSTDHGPILLENRASAARLSRMRAL